MKKAIFNLILFSFISLSLYSQHITVTNGEGRRSHVHSVGDGSGTLNPTYFVQNVCGLNFVQGSQLVETRTQSLSYNTNGTGNPTTVTISGLPATCRIIQKAYLYYSASYTESTAPSSTAKVTNPLAVSNTYAATTIGTGPSKGWGETGSAVYRADVTPIISGNGVYSITINGFTNASWEVDGVSLVIVYASGPSATGTGSMVLLDGIISTGLANSTENVSGFNVCSNGTASSFGIYSDMQANDNGNSNTETFNGTTASFANNFWNFNQINSAVVAGQTTTTFISYTNNGSTAADKYAWIVAGFYWHNTGCLTCAPTISFSNVQPTCGNNNGTSNAIVIDGTPPYTYSWSPSGGTNAIATGLSSGVYTVTVEDLLCNTSTGTVTLTSTPPVVVSATTISNVSCNGGSTGSASATVTAGTSPYTYQWSPGGGTKSTVSNLSAGTYTITVTDRIGCTGTATVIITQPSVVTATISSTTNESCNGGSNGSATATASGGTPGYVYLWTPGGSTTSTASGLSVGTYTVKVTDANGCTATTTVSITQPAKLTATITSRTSVLCNGGNTGTATVTAGGGTPVYTYSWIPTGKTTSSATGLSAGNYTVTVTDASGCTATVVVTIIQPAKLNALITSVTNLSCNGTNNGIVTSAASGGAGPYTYSWAPVSSTNSFATGLSAGTYTVFITDKNGCTASGSAIITQPPPIVATITSATNVSCFGNNNGAATVTVSGGNPVYTYSWSPNGNTTSTITGITAGTYTVVVTDAKGCTTSTTAIITQPAVVTATITQINVLCHGTNSGSATVTVSGGSSPFTYAWSPSGGSTSAATGLTAGSYTVTVTDKNGCSQTASVIITQPTAITTTMSSTFGCGNGSGTATVSVAGGSAPYTYSWAPGGGTTSTISGLTAGTYTITVTDKNGCVVTNTVVASQPNALVVTPKDTAVQCNGGSTGIASVIASGGHSPYTYLWAPGGSTTSSISGLSAGTYTSTVTDNTGCSVTTVIIITQPPPITVTTGAITNELCNGNSTGAASITASGGVPAYTYSWSPGGGTKANVTGLSATNYTVTVTDSHGCTANSIITITQPAPLTDSLHLTPPTCVSASGSITVIPIGGTPAYTYHWAPGGKTTATITGLSTGTYTVTITDSHGCSETVPVALYATSDSIAASGTIFCSGGNTATATVYMIGGTSPFTYTWSTGKTTSSITGISAGTYTVSVKDSNGCNVTASIIVSQPPPITMFVSNNINPLCHSDSTGSATINVSGGASPYFYSWSPGGGTSSTESGLSAGTYKVVVTDIHGCKDSINVTLIQPTTLSVSATQGGTILCHGGSGATAIASIAGGTSPYTYHWYPGGGTTNTITGLSAGRDSLVVIDSNGCSGTTVITITQPPPLVDSLAVILSSCATNNGQLTAITTGGTGVYTYLWAPGGQTSASITGLSSGNYTVTIKDANGCTTSSTGHIQNIYDSVTSLTNVACNGGSTGSATVVEVGGISPFTYLWTPTGKTTSTATGLSAGTYTVSITDPNHCVVTTTVIITQPPLLTNTTTINSDVLCNGGNTGSATITAAGGNTPYTYFWALIGNSTSTVTGLTAGTYTVTVLDAGTCSTTANIIITQPPLLNETVTITGVACHGQSNGIATVTTTGGTSPYTYSWAPGNKTTASITGLSAGTYTITVKDNNGCSVSQSVIITQPAVLTTSITASTNVLCFGSSTGSATASGAGGTSPYTYSWAPGGNSTATVSGLSAGTYTVTVSDSNGCTSTKTVIITQPPAISITFASIKNISCNGANDGSATVHVSGGSGTYTYQWSPGGGSSVTVSGLSIGTYTILVTDSHGCSSTNSVTISQPPVLSVSLSLTTPILCSNSNTGSATSLASGGTVPYTYNWSPSGQSTANATGLSAGTYTLTVTDSNRCSASDTIILTQPPALSISATTTPITCNGNSNGSATATVTGGMPVYTYLWAPGGSTTSTITGLSAGTYTLTVKDSYGCVITQTVILTQPSGLSVSLVTSTNIACANGSTGRAGVDGNGGTRPYTYLWAPGGQSSNVVSNLSAGTYTVTVTDLSGCTATVSFILTQPPPLNDSVTTTPTSCGSNRGTGTAFITGGTPGYIYSWSPSGNTNAFATGLSAGTYTLSVTDANGCTASAVSVVYSSAPTLSTSTSVSCNGGNNGSATVTISGGTPPFTYSWSPSGQTTQTASNLSAGVYIVSITDASGCNVLDTVIITQPPPIVIVDSSTMVSCHGLSNGNSTVTVTGGSSPYQYSWAPGGQTSSAATGLSAGTYTLFVTDASGCIVTDTVIITQPPGVTTSVSVTSTILCFGGTTGSASISASGGYSPYTYSWSPGGNTTTSVSGLSAGTYIITLTDSLGCAQYDTAIITQPPLLVATITGIQNVSCGGPNSGAANVAASGGTSPYTYFWTASGNTTTSVSGLSVGTYTVDITDSNGCTASTTAVILQAANLTSSVTSVTNILCGGNSTGSISVNVTGGTQPYTYSWAPGGNSTATATGLSAGTYTLYVTDSTGCTTGNTVTLTQPPPLVVLISVSAPISCNKDTTGALTCTVSGGISPYTYLWSNSGTSSAISGLSAGTYSITVTDSSGCSATNSIVLTEPPALFVVITSLNNVLCFGNNSGSATDSVEGGTSPYTYLWSPSGGSSSSAGGLSAGTYSVSITDAHGCTISDTIVITQPTLLTVSINSMNVNCNGNNNGEATTVVAGGTQPYTYSWSPGGSTVASISALAPGTYLITITDSNGCTATASVTITQPPAISNTLTSVNVNCFGDTSGSITATTSGGTQPYTYSWAPVAGTNALLSNLGAGSYTVTITDSNHCSIVDSAVLTQPTALVVSTSGAATICVGFSTKLSSIVSGGVAPYTYLWNNGATTDSVTVSPSSTETFTLIVTDAHGCIDSATVVVTVNPPISAVITGDTVLCPGSTAKIMVQAFGGDGMYHYSWIPSGLTTNLVTFILTNDTTLTVEITDNCGTAMLTETVNILVAPIPNVQFTSIPDSGCSPLCVQFGNLSTLTKGSIIAYTWSFDTNKNDTSNLVNPVFCYTHPGKYNVSLVAVTSAGCSSTLTMPDYITVYPNPQANFTYSPSLITTLDNTVQFDDESTGPAKIYFWWWNFGDGSSPDTAKNPSHLYSDTGTICVTEHVLDKHGCSDSVTNCFVIEPLFTFYIPDAFTPNDDGINDIFQPKGTYVKNYTMYIYNRWGQQIFYSDDFNTGWNGRVNNVGIMSQEDVYIYIINVTDALNKKHSYTGKVSLIR